MRRRPALEKELADNARLLRAWKNFHREERAAALAGPHGHMIERLLFILKELSQKSAPLLIAYIRGVDWSTVDYPTRLTVLHEINTAITKLRERAGMAPFDDPLDDRLNVFQRAKALLFPV